MEPMTGPEKTKKIIMFSGPFAKSQWLQWKYEEIKRQGRRLGLRGKKLTLYITEKMEELHLC